jgi:RNA polymerase sigma-70 factor, ECF subfamily
MVSPNRLETEQLLAAVRRGHSDSLGMLLEQYRDYLYLIARARIGARLQARANASDVVQETFLLASRHFDQFAGTSEREWQSWLRSILRRRLLRLVRKQVIARKRSVRREVPLKSALNGSDSAGGKTAGALVDPGSSPSAPVRRHELAAEMAERLSRLPASYRDVLVLRNLQGLAFAEVARRMGRTVGAVRVLWLRALDRLRQQHLNEEVE